MTWDVAAQRPKFTTAEAIELARNLYGKTAAAARELPSDRDQNFFLEMADGAAYVLKIAGAAEEESVLNFQNQALLHLAGREDLAEFIPRLCPAAGGAVMSQAAGADGQIHFVRLMAHLPGAPLAGVNPHSGTLLAESGRLLGRVDGALLDFGHPAMDRRLHWDLAHAQATLAQYAPYIEDAEKRALVAFFLERYLAEAGPLLPSLRRSVIHSDGNDHNILISADKKAPRQRGGAD